MEKESYIETSDSKILEDVKIYRECISRSFELLQDSESSILSLEESPDDVESLELLFRSIHSLKGSAGFLGLARIQDISHEMETVLDKARKFELTITPPVADVLLESIDILGRLLDRLSIRVAKVSGVTCEMTGKSKPGEEIYIKPILKKIRAIQCCRNETKDDKTTEVQEPIPVDDNWLIPLEGGESETKQIENIVEKQVNQNKESTKSTLKVETSKLDDLFDLVQELVVTNSLINEEYSRLKVELKYTSRNIPQLTKIVKDIQDQTMALRMVPLKETFIEMQRLVRDVAATTGKSVKLIIEGEETELGKNLIDKITDPLVHILRNAVDHGIESKEARVKLNKPEKGIVRLSAFQERGRIVIKISDDGKGLSRAKITKKAIEKGIVSDPSTLTDEQILDFIFCPGFSTAENVTNISGRGVGMDVVKQNINTLHGSVSIESDEGKGSVFTIRLPMTIAIVDGIVVQIGDERYIIPIVNVVESIQPGQDMISTVQKKNELLNVRGELIPLVRLNKLFMLDTGKDMPCEAIVVIVQAGKYKLGLMVDDILGDQQVVIKNLGKRFKNSIGISGAAIMGNGEVGLILDVNGINELVN